MYGSGWRRICSSLCPAVRRVDPFGRAHSGAGGLPGSRQELGYQAARRAGKGKMRKLRQTDNGSNQQNVTPVPRQERTRKKGLEVIDRTEQLAHTHLRPPFYIREFLLENLHPTRLTRRTPTPNSGKSSSLSKPSNGRTAPPPRGRRRPIPSLLPSPAPRAPSPAQPTVNPPSCFFVPLRANSWIALRV